jgi:hypothetical protein
MSPFPLQGLPLDTRWTRLPSPFVSPSCPGLPKIDSRAVARFKTWYTQAPAATRDGRPMSTTYAVAFRSVQ